jgi:hypothetical protein
MPQKPCPLSLRQAQLVELGIFLATTAASRPAPLFTVQALLAHVGAVVPSPSESELEGLLYHLAMFGVVQTTPSGAWYAPSSVFSPVYQLGLTPEEEYAFFQWVKAQRYPHCPHLSKRRRFAILKRDNYRCRLCGASAKDGPHVRLEVDHITARVKGGTNDDINLWTLCQACNSGKGMQDL